MLTRLPQILFLVFITWMPVTAQSPDGVPPVEHVLHVSMDGLRPDVITSLGADRLPNFFRFRTEGAWTDNARTDQFNTSTLPGHTSQLTSRPVFGESGHGWWWNSNPGTVTLHGDGYIASAFDVAHDHGLSTALYAGKSKFIVFDNSYDANSGAPDQVDADNGRDKIDTYVYDGDMEALTAAFVADYRARQYEYAFFHFRNPDGQGHSTGWELDPSTAYAQKVAEVDRLLGTLFEVIETTPGLAGRTAIVLTADHGGELGGKGHGNLFNPDNYTIPFYVWGPSVAMGADLYALNPTARQDPGTRQPANEESVQPIRYGDVANLSLAMLGLPSVPGSRFNADQSLRITPTIGQMVLVFQQGLDGYTGTVDTYVRRHRRDDSYGNRSTLIVDDADPWWSGRDNQSLLRFENLIGSDDNQVPPNAQVQQATLNLRVINPGDGGSFHRMLRSWDENATWNSLNSGLSADNVEALREADARSQGVSEGSLSIDVTASVQAWARGAANEGWAILPGGGNGWDVYSAEGFMPPRLVVTYGYAAYAARSLPEAILDKGKAKDTKVSDKKPMGATLLGNYPNPFSEATTITFTLHESQHVRLEVHDTQGRPVGVLVDETRPAGTHSVLFQADGFVSGLYLVRFLANGSDVQSSRMVVQ